MKTNLNEAKTAKATAEADLKAIQKKIEDCGDNVTGDCDTAVAFAEAQTAFDFATADYDMVNETFSYVAEELKLKEEEATARAIQKQRTAVVNMVKNDVHVIQGTVDKLFGRVEWIQNTIDTLLSNQEYRCEVSAEGSRRRL